MSKARVNSNDNEIMISYQVSTTLVDKALRRLHKRAGSLFLNKGITRAFFSLFGYLPEQSESLIRTVKV